MLRHVIEHSLLAAHRHVFGVFFWFVVLSALGLGPAGAVLYRMAEFVSRYWAYQSTRARRAGQRPLMQLSQRLFALIDSRAGAPHGLRLRGGRQLRGGDQRLAARRRRFGSTPTKASSWRPLPAPWACSWAAARRRASRPTARRPSRAARRRGAASAARVDTRRCRRRSAHLRSIVGLVWRSVVLWMLLLALLTLANLIG